MCISWIAGGTLLLVSSPSLPPGLRLLTVSDVPWFDRLNSVSVVQSRTTFQTRITLEAMDRIHRLGQHRPVHAIKFIIEDSIESRIVELQEKKSAMVNATLSTDDSVRVP